MIKTAIASTILMLLIGSPATAGTLVIPSFAHNVAGLDGNSWSTEIYLANPTHLPVQVSLDSFLPGYVKRPTPCDLFMPPTRVVPPRSAVVWNAAGLAVDLGCAEEALGALVLNTDGPIEVTSRLVSHGDGEPASASGLLIGRGQEVRAIQDEDLPQPGSYLLPALTWRCEACKVPAFDTYLGFANPGPDVVAVHIELPEGTKAGSVALNGATVELPATIEVEPESWFQARVVMTADEERVCDGPETFDLLISTDRRLAFYATVVDRTSHDARTVEPVALH